MLPLAKDIETSFWSSIANEHRYILCDPVWKTSLIAYLKVSRNASFKYLVCCSSPMV